MLVDVNYEELLTNKATFKLSDGDEVFISQIDSEIINRVTLKGAVRVPNDYEITETTTVGEVIKRAGGILYSTYSPKAYIVRTSKSDFKKSYLKFNVDSVLNFPNIKTNYILKPLDVIEIFSKHRFEDSIKIKINGAVRIPGLYTFGAGFSLKDALYYAGGLRPEAAGNRIEVSRIINLNELTKDGSPSKTAIKTVQINTDLTIDEESEKFELQPYDEIFVRQLPEFEYQQDVYLTGEVKYPGAYSLISKNERMMDVINRAGGLLPSAFHKGIILIIKEKKLGLVVVDIDKAIRRPNSQFNYFLRKGDSLKIDKINELVSIIGDVQFSGIDSTKQVNVPYFTGKRAGFYVKNFVGGFKKDALRRKTTVMDANGRIRSTRKVLGIFNLYPKVNMGSKIFVPIKTIRTRDKNGQPIDWNRVIENTTVKITAVLTVIILAQRINIK
jgi:protein involved in polysaccharide export with SLBB domain